MSNLLSWDRFKFKLLVYNITGITLTFFIQAIITYNIVSQIIASKLPFREVILNYTGVVVVDIIITVLVILFYTTINSVFNDRLTIFGYYEYFSFFGNTKIVSHSKLGKFLLYIECNNGSTKICVYDVGFFSHRCIDYFFLNGGNDINVLIKFVNDILDYEYEKRMVENKSRKNDIDFIKKWDGYLDTEGKRDNKIKEILK